VKPDLLKVTQQWSKARPLRETDRYLRDRGIPDSVLQDPIFEDRIRIDARGNTVFPHWNETGYLCGFELKNNGFTGFAPGGEKGLWYSRARSSDNIMIVAESTIDALSVAAAHRSDGKRFFSIAGKCAPYQIKLLVAAAKKMPEHSMVWLCLDNDESGRKMAAEIRDVMIKQAIDSKRIVLKLPVQENWDWNDVLRHAPKHSKPKVSLSDQAFGPSV
jgi:hypothetical protein